MKRFLLALLLFIAIKTNAQLVTTVAGTLSKIGSLNGAALGKATFNNPHGIYVAKDGNIYIADRYNHIIRKIDTNGNVTTLAGSGSAGSNDGIGTSASFNEPWGLTADSLGNVYVADTKNNKIRKINPNGVVSTLAGTGNFGITDSNNPLAASFGNPTDLVFDKKGNLYVAEHLTHLIRKINPSGVVSTFAGNRNYPSNTGLVDGLGLLARFNRPYGIDIDALGNLYVADEWNHAIRKISPLGIVSTLAGNGTIGNNQGIGSSATFNFPWDVAVDSTGKVYVTDGRNFVIRTIDLNNEVKPFVGLQATPGATDGFSDLATFNGATSISFNYNQSALFVGDPYNQLIRKITFINEVSKPDIRFESKLSKKDSITICKNSPLKLYLSGKYSSYDVFLDSVLLINTTDSILDLSSLPAGKASIYVIGKKDGYESKSSNLLKYHIKPNNTANILSSKNAPFCVGDSTYLYTSNKSKAYWNTQQFIDSILVKSSGKYYFIENEKECYTKQDTISIKFNPNPNITISTSKPGPYEEGESIYLIANGAKNYEWSSTEKKDSIKVSSSGNYIVKGIDINTCFSYSDTLKIIFSPPSTKLKINTINGVYFCANDSLKILANIAAPIKWYHMDTLLATSDSILYVKQPGNYYFTNYTGTIKHSDTIKIEMKNKPIIDFTSDFKASNTIVGDNIEFKASNQTLDSYSWDFGDNQNLLSKSHTATHNYQTLGKYTVNLEVKDIYGCSSKIEKKDYISFDSKLFIANAFTPNGDLINDEIVLRGVENGAQVDFKIFNEWGEVVFSSKEKNATWNGFYKGEIANQGNYAYLLILKSNNVEQMYKGIITLIK